MEDKILEQLDRIERNTLLAAKNVLTIRDVSALTGLSLSWIYKATCERRIPHYKPSGKILYFDRKEIEDWMRQGKQLSNDELEQQAINFCVTNKKG